MFEADLIPVLCAVFLGGTPEARIDYTIDDGDHHVRVDCLTETHAIEVGLDDRRSSSDSVHQALFYAFLSGRDPMVVIIDTNGVEEAVEYQVETVAREAGVAYRVVDLDYLIRLQMTAHFRAREPRAIRP